MNSGGRPRLGARLVCYFAAAILSSWCLGYEIPGVGLSVVAVGTVAVAAAGLPVILFGRLYLRWPLLLIAFIGLHLIVVNPFTDLAFKVGLAAQVVVAFGFFLAIVNLSRDLDVYSRMITILLITTTVIVGALLYIHLVVFQSQFLSIHFTQEAYQVGGRAGRNTLSYFLVIAFPFAYARFSHSRTLVNTLMMVVIGFAALYTISRMALLSIIATLVLFALLGTHASRYRRQLVAVGLAVLVILPIGYGIDLWTTFLRIRNPAQVEAVEAGDVSLVPLEGDRYNLIWWALDGLASSPVVGRGLGSFQAELGAESHNDYLRLLYEFGVVGLALFAGIVWGAFRDLRRCRWAVPPEHRWLVDGQTVSMICTFGGLLTINAYDAPPVWFVLAGSQIIPMAVTMAAQRVRTVPVMRPLGAVQSAGPH